MSKAVLVTNKFSIVLKGVEKKIKDLGYEVKMIKDGFNKISEEDYKADLILLYMTDDLLRKSINLDMILDICDNAKHNNCGIVLVDGDQNHHEFLRVAPKLKSFGWVDVPLDSKKFVSTIEEELKRAPGRMIDRRILIVDDDEIFGSMIKNWFKDEYKVSYLSEGKQVLTFLASSKVDLILLDYEMPVMNGPEVLEMLRSNRATKEIPVIFLTGVSDRASIEKVLKLRPEGYVLKTATRDEIAEKLRTFFENRQ
ncbi:MAG: response regulator [Lachnospiraceae bacterium]|nr:response regulator [Lachnospiraceae bacterium]